MEKRQKNETPQNNELPKLQSSPSLDDILASWDDGTNGEPLEEFEIIE